MRNAGLEEAQAGIKIARRNINQLRYADDTTLMAETKEELKSFLMKVKWCERPCCWARLKAGGEGDDRGWDGWMTSSTRWTWVWTSSRGWWWTGKPGVLQSVELQRFRHDWVTELNWWMSMPLQKARPTYGPTKQFRRFSSHDILTTLRSPELTHSLSTLAFFFCTLELLIFLLIFILKC